MVLTHIVFLFGLAAVAVPLLIHLLTRRRCHRVRFSALIFVAESLAKREKNIRLHDILLLTLRCLILVLMTAGFAGPAYRVAAVREGRELIHCIAIDNSLSTSVMDATGQTVFDRIKAASLDFIKGSGRDGTFIVYTFADGLTAENVDAAQAAGIVEMTESDGGGQQGLKAFIERLRLIDRKRYCVEVCVISDFGSKVIRELVKGGFDAGCDSVCLTAISADEALRNAAVVDAGVTDYHRGRLTCRAEVENRGTTPQRRELSVTGKGRVLSKKTVELRPQEKRILSFTIDVEAGSVPLEFALDPTDMLRADDVYRMGVRVIERDGVDILLVADAKENMRFVEAGLDGLNACAATPEIRVHRIIAPDAPDFGTLNPDVIIAEIGSECFLRNAEAFRNRIQAGANAFLFMSGHSDMKRLVRLLDAGGFPLPVAFVSGAPQQLNCRLAAGDGLMDAIGHYDPSRIDFHTAYPLRLNTQGKPVWWFENGTLFIAQQELGKGRLTVINTSPDASMSALSSDVMWPMFCRVLFGLSTQPKVFAYSVDSPVRLEARAGQNDMTVIGVDSRRRSVAQSGGVFDLSESARKPGWIVVPRDNRWIGVNPSPDETLMAEGDFTAARRRIENVAGRRTETDRASAFDADVRVYELWKWFIGAALLLLPLDLFLARKIEAA